MTKLLGRWVLGVEFSHLWAYLQVKNIVEFIFGTCLNEEKPCIKRMHQTCLLHEVFIAEFLASGRYCPPDWSATAVCDSDRNCSCAGLGTREALSGLFWLLKLKRWHMVVEWEIQLVELEQISYCPSLLLFQVCCHQLTVLPWRSIMYLPFNLLFYRWEISIF